MPVDKYSKVCIMVITSEQTYEVSGYGAGQNRTIEDSLENTFSCVPKVQGKLFAESLRQKDRDAKRLYAVIRAVHLWAAVFYFHRKKDVYYA